MTAPSTVALTKDAKNRSWRTILQGLVATVAVAAYPVVNDALRGGIEHVDWGVLKISLANTVVMAVLSFAWRRWLDPSRIPSATPPT